MGIVKYSENQIEIINRDLSVKKNPDIETQVNDLLTMLVLISGSEFPEGMQKIHMIAIVDYLKNHNKYVVTFDEFRRIVKTEFLETKDSFRKVTAETIISIFSNYMKTNIHFRSRANKLEQEKIEMERQKKEREKWKAEYSPEKLHPLYFEKFKKGTLTDHEKEYMLSFIYDYVREKEGKIVESRNGKNRRELVKKGDREKVIIEVDSKEEKVSPVNKTTGLSLRDMEIRGAILLKYWETKV